VTVSIGVMRESRIRSMAGGRVLLAVIFIHAVLKRGDLVSCTRIVVLFIALLGLMIYSSSIRAAVTPPTVNGNLSDWGITLSSGSNPHLVYASGYGYSYNSNQNIEKHGQMTFNGNTIIYDLEDSNDLAGKTGYVGPLYGGQDYDAEALVVSVVGTNLYIGIATGQRPDNGISYFAPGDISMTKGTDVWGVEVGGGTGNSNSSNPSKIVGGDSGTTYQLDSGGSTVKAINPKNPYQEAGSIWKTVSTDWKSGISSSGDPMTQLNITSPSAMPVEQLGQSNYVYNFDSSFGSHAFIELCIPNYETVFGDDPGNAVIRWAPACGNDILSVSVYLPGSQGAGSVPEPASMMIWAVLLLSAVCVARKKLLPLRRP